jgi:hypothetical protein
VLWLSSRAPSAPAALFPANVLGKTFAWDPDSNRYRLSNQTGAPANGVRFLLYVTGTNGLPVEPLQPLGYVDLTDESTPSADVLGVLVQFGSQTVADYTISFVATTSSATITASGSLFGSTGSQVDFTLINGYNDATGTFTTDYHLEASNGFSIDFDLTQTETSASLDFVLSDGSNSIQLTANVGPAGISGQIRFNGTTVATITGDPENPTITGAGGRDLTDQEIAELEAMFGTAVELLFGVLFAVFAPSFFLFGSV